MMRYLWVGLILAGQAAVAAAPTSSPRPEARALSGTPVAAVAAIAADPLAELRPRARPRVPKTMQDAIGAAPTSEDIAANTHGVAFLATAGRVVSPVPVPRPGWIVAAASRVSCSPGERWANCGVRSPTSSRATKS